MENDLGSIQLMIRNDELWFWGGQGGKAYGFQLLDKQTLKPKGTRYKTGLTSTEQARASVDHTGDLHGAGTPHQKRKMGYYNSLSRIKQGNPDIRYETTMQHHSSGAAMIKDTKAKDRVYVVYWSGGGDEYSHDGGCKNHIKLHF